MRHCRVCMCCFRSSFCFSPSPSFFHRLLNTIICFSIPINQFTARNSQYHLRQHQLVAGGARVRVLARNDPSNGARDESGAVEFVRGSVLNKADVVKAAEGVDGIFHLAGAVYHTVLPAFVAEMQDINVRGTLNVIEAAAVSKYVSALCPCTLR
eukprot:Opistho-2@55302